VTGRQELLAFAVLVFILAILACIIAVLMAGIVG